MSFKVVLSNTKETVPVKDLEEVKKILEMIAKGDSMIVCQGGIFNPSYMVGVVYDKERARIATELRNLGRTEKQIGEGIGASKFARLLSPKMEMLSAPERTKASEEAAKEERKLKSKIK